jgi:hypothetical protein
VIRGKGCFANNPREDATARDNARKKRGAQRLNKTVINWDDAVANLYLMFAELYPDETTGMSTGTSL